MDNMNFCQRAKELVAQMTIEEKMSQMNYNSPAIKRLGIPKYTWWNECLHGVARSGVATVFPQAIGMAATFNTDLMYEVANAISDEARAKYNEYIKFGGTEIYQGLTFCAPNINIFRDPRWGRGHETYGEDPYLTGRMGVAFIKGLQGDGKYRKCDATLKHFAVHSGPEATRHGFNVDIDDETLYSTYLAAFEYCIKNADPSSVMGAYNAVNGEPCTASKTLLIDILRNKFGFEGYIESDAGGVEDINNYHKLTSTLAESAAMSVNNGCDLCIGSAYESLPEAYEKGYISEDTITEAVERLFSARFRLGMFDDDCEYNNIPFDTIECEKHQNLNLKMAQESIVLLKNDGILPLDKNLKIAVIGPNADDKDVLLGNYNGVPSEYTTFLKGIQKNCNKVNFAKGCELYKFGEAGAWEERVDLEALVAAKNSDVIVMVMGLHPSVEGEQTDDFNASFGGDKASIELFDIQKKLYKKIKELGKPIVFVNVSGSCIALGEQKESANAIIQCFYPGAKGGDALADILFGKVSPSGRLPVTFYKSDSDLPPFDDYSMKNRTYKFFEGEPLFEFGFGLTYSTITENWLDENTVEIENTGDYDTDYSVLKFEYVPHKTLTDFIKIHMKKGEKKIIKF